MTRLADKLVATWYAPRATPLALLLAPLAALFGGIVALRRALYGAGLRARTHPGVPVIVVGNIGVGGAGKTPLVLALAAALRARGFHPAVISRGSGRRGAAARAVHDDDRAEDVGDEPLLLARRGLPVAVAARRIAAARCILAAAPATDVLIADDGLQHYALARDVEVAVVDGTRAFGNGLLLPAGPLREPRARLAVVDAVVVNGAGTPLDVPEAAHRMTLVPEGFVRVADAAERVPPTHFAGRRAHAVAGIGHPERFFATLRALGVEVVPHAYPDHHRFTPDDLAWPGPEAILMTEKDAVKCTRFAGARCWYLRVNATIDDALVDHLVARVLAAAKRAS